MMPHSSSPTTAEEQNNNISFSVSTAPNSAMYSNSHRGSQPMNRNVHSSHGYGGGPGSDGTGRGGSHHHHLHGMNPGNNPTMDSYSTGRSSSRMTLQQNSMGSNAPLTPGGGMGNSSYPGQSSQDAGSPVTTSAMGSNMGYGGAMDSMSHSGMMGNNMFDLRGSSGSGGHQSMGSYSGAVPGPSDLDSRSLMATASRRSGGGGGSSSGRSSSGAAGSSSSSGAAGGSSRQTQEGSSSRSSTSGSLSQAEREEELLLNLLIARRQRGRSAGGEPSPALRDELMRIRQQGGMDPSSMGGASSLLGGSASSGGTMGGSGVGPGASSSSLPPQMHGLPSMYDGGMSSGMMGNSNSNASSGYPSGDMGDQRIDRTPHYLMDARTQDMMGYRSGGSGGGMSTGGGPSAGMKRGAPSMPYDPSGFVPNNQLKYPSYGMMTHPHAMVHTQNVHGAMGGGGVMMGSGMPPPSKKRRSHKKKPADMPRRPLSAYNLFFSEERERILKEIDGKEDGGENKDEDGDKKEDEGNDDVPPTEEDKKETDKPKALLRPLIPSQKKRRPHRKTHGKISFQQLARMVGERWKSLPEDRRKYYQNLAQEDMKRQKEAMEEYYARQQAIKHGTAPPSVDKSSVKAEDEDEEDDPTPKALEPQVQEGMVGGERSDL